MGLFRKTLSDIEKYRSSQNTGKLLDALGAKDPETAQAALRALMELNKAGSFEGMILGAAASPHLQVRREFLSFIARDPGAYSGMLAEALVSELKGLVLSDTLPAVLKRIVAEERPGSLPVLEEWLSALRETSVTEVRKLLDHEIFLVNAAAAELLKKWGDGESRAKAAAVLERRDITFMNLGFCSQVLNESIKPGEIPLAYVYVCTLSRKFDQLPLYTLGLTDEAVLILPEYGLVHGIKAGKWRIGLAHVRSTAFAADGRFTIDLAVRVMDPGSLAGPETSVLAFKPWKRKDTERAGRVVRLFDIVKQGRLTKSEIAETHFDEKNVSIDD